ncbi:hypothetical protein QJQ45_000243 [Haematococcus lacustris]|nr:hypothetical protein QJQ45_000243 [Haematococcus lacustris]
MLKHMQEWHAANNTVLSCSQFVKAELRLPGVTVPCQLNVMPSLLPDFDVLLGNDWLNEHEAVMSYQDKTLSLACDKSEPVVLPCPSAGVSEPGQSAVSNPASFLVNALRAKPPLASAKVAARWLRKGGTGVLALITVDNSSAPDPAPAEPDLPPGVSQALNALMDEYADVFAPITSLPPERPVGHAIPLVPDARPSVVPQYRMSQDEHAELKKQVQDLLAKGMIEPSSSPFAAPILFVKKKSGELRMCLDYRQLNKITIRDQYPLPRIDDLFDKLSGCTVFSSLDLQSGYNQIRITPEDVPKTAFRTPDGHYQFKVLSFGLCNAPATFQRVMNDAFAPVLNQCALVYLDDILVMSKSVDEHLKHLRKVFDLLRLNKLYAKQSKCEFMRVGAVLMQDGYPLAYLSKKLSSAERNYTTGALQVDGKDMLVDIGLVQFDSHSTPNRLTSAAAGRGRYKDFDVLLGNDWLNEHEAVMSYQDKTLSLACDKSEPVVLPCPSAGVSEPGQSAVSNPASFLVNALRAKPPLASAKVAARWLRKGGTGVLALITVDNSSAPDPAPAEPDLPPGVSQALNALMDEYADVFAPITSLPPERPVGHAIPLVPDARPSVVPQYRMSQDEHAELKKQVQDLLAKGMIEPSSSPFAAPILFVKKKSGELRMCLDYRQLNKITIRDQYPLPRIDDLFDKLSGCTVFSSLDLQSGYNQIRITPEDVPKTAFRTPDGHYQFKVLSFGLCNAPATFQRVMNDAFAPVLNQCALVYLDDILVMSKSVDEHLKHLRKVFDLLRLNKLYAKQSKCEFMRVGAVLMQDGYPLAYLSKKLSSAERNYTTGALQVDGKDMLVDIGLVQFDSHSTPNRLTSAAAGRGRYKDFDVLLGNDWLNEHEAVMSYQDKTLSLACDKSEPVVLPCPSAGVSEPGQSAVSNPASFLVNALRAKPPLASAKVAARWLRKGGTGVLALITVDNSSAPDPAPAEPDLPPGVSQALNALMDEYADVFAPITSLPPERPVGHAIPLVPDARPSVVPQYRMSQDEHAELKKQVQDLLAKGMIEPSSSPFAAPILFVKKKSGELRMCLDYRQLNKITIRDQYPLPRIDDLFDKLSGCTVFSSLDLQSGYNQIRITPEDVPKTAFRTPDGHYQFKVLSFGLCNAPATFQRVMNDAFAPVLNQCALVYLDDILVMSKSVDEHLKHLRKVFDLLRLNKLYAKQSKCEFMRTTLKFLGVGAVLMQDGYPLAYLSKKLSSAERNYTTGEQELLALITACKEWRCYLEGVPFTLFTDHKPLTALPTQKEKELGKAALLGAGGQELGSQQQCLPYGPEELVAAADPLSRIPAGPQDCAMVCVVTTRRQAKQSLERGEVRVAQALPQVPPVGTPSNAPTAVDALAPRPTVSDNPVAAHHSRLPELEAPSAADTSVHYPAAPAHPLELADHLVHGYRLDPAFTVEADLSGMYMDDHGLWRRTGKGTVMVPNDPELREYILHEMHDAAYAGHVGITKTLERLSRVFYWDTMRADVRHYVTTCDACQRDKSSTLKPGGLLNPLSIPDYRWESVSMDLITKLPSASHGFDAICVFVDRLSKMVHFVPCKESMNAKGFARLFVDNVFKLHGLPKDMVSDRGPHFHNTFWHHVQKLLGMRGSLSSSYHPQSDGQTERYNRVLEEMLRDFISPTQADWPDYLSLAEFAVNNSWQESIKSTPFLVNTGQSPITPMLHSLPDKGRCPEGLSYATWWQGAVAKAKLCMQAAQQRQAAYANQDRRDVHYKVGQMVLLSTKNMRLKPGKARKLLPRFVGPFKMLDLVGQVAVNLQLPASMSRLHPVFHVSLIKPYTGTDVGFMPPPVEWLDEEPVYYVERLLDHRHVHAGKAKEYLAVFFVSKQAR